MNMKKVAVLPLAVVAMGLTSCNKGWPTITNDEAKDLVQKVIDEKKAGFTNLSKKLDLKLNSNTNTKVNNHSFDDKGSSKIKFDLEKNYLYQYEANSDAESESKSEEYKIFKDSKAYRLNKLTYTKQIDEGFPTVVSEQTWKDEIYAGVKSEFKNSVSEIYEDVFFDCENFNDLIKTYDANNEESKQNGGYFKYTFVSNDKTKNVGIKFEQKQIIKATETTPSVEGYGTLEVKFENNYLTYIKYNSNVKTGKIGEIPAYEITSTIEGTANYNPSISIDYNFDEYTSSK